tara:strand:- start:37 stop:1095 length:1059 start_codon:yes stop_codon:yes gene_type:complete
MAYTTIDDPSVYFQVATWTGNGGSDRAIVNDGNSAMQPDWVWYKSRSHATSHISYDSSRGDGPYLKPSDAGDEGTDAQMFESFDSDGFSLNGDTDGNGSGRTYVAWQWKCNGGTTSSLSGNLDSVVQVNATAGFSIVKYTGSGGNGQSVSHGLGLTPEVIITKSRNADQSWHMYHKSIGNTKIIKLDTTAAQATSSDYSAAAVNSSSFFVSTSLIYVGELGADYVSYCFAPIQGYSKFGSYVGNGNANGPYVHCGFKPAFVLIKNVDVTQVWIMYDGKRKSFNQDAAVNSIYASEVSAEYTGASYHNLDILSNGFKIRLTDASQNGNGNKHIYMAFAENPFVTSEGSPTTAR